MNMASLFFLSLLLSCTGHHNQSEMPAFVKEKVCSKESLAYLNQKQEPLPPSVKRYTSLEIHTRLLALEPLVLNCYEEEMDRNNATSNFNLCLVIGYDQKANQKFFEFSTNEIKISKKI